MSQGSLSHFETNLICHLQWSSSPHPENHPKPSTANNVRTVVQTFERLERKLDRLNHKFDDSLSTLDSWVRSLDITCRTETEPRKRWHDDQEDPDRYEGEAKKCQRVREQMPTETTGVGASESTPGAGTDTTIAINDDEERPMDPKLEACINGRKVIYVDPDVQPLSIVPVGANDEIHKVINVEDLLSDNHQWLHQLPFLNLLQRQFLHLYSQVTLLHHNKLDHFCSSCIR